MTDNLTFMIEIPITGKMVFILSRAQVVIIGYLLGNHKCTVSHYITGNKSQPQSMLTYDQLGPINKA